MSRPGPSPPPALTPIASTSTAHLGHRSVHADVRHRHDKQPVTYPPQQSCTPSTTRPKRRKRRDGEKKGRRLLRWRRGLVTEAFRKFGEHCARNQIRTLLIDCLVMTNLFYPSMALYLQKRFPPLHPPSPPSHRMPLQGEPVPSTYRQNQREHPLSLLSTPVLDSFFPYPPPLLPQLTWAGWWGRDTGQYDQDDHGWGLSRALPEGAKEQVLEDEEIRIMRVAWADVEDVLDRDVDAGERDWEERDHVLLRLVRDIAEEWETKYTSTGERCIRQLEGVEGGTVEATGPCFILSPNHDTPNIEVNQISISALTSGSHNSISPSDDGSFDWTASTGNIYHSLGVLFHVPQNSIDTFEMRWKETINEVAQKVEGEVFTEAQRSNSIDVEQTGEWYLSYTSPSQFKDQPSAHDHPHQHTSSLPTSPPKIVLFLYAVLLTTLMAQISNASKVHSRFGLAFTGVVQLCCSSVMSFSVLALLGWNGWGASVKQSSLPTYVLPFVIVVVGAENMSTLTKAIFSIPFTHSVPVRIGLGLSKVGTTIALTSLTDLLVLGVVWLCVNLQPVREFCLFAAVVIITDWFMLHTFFLTVLSIDAQRLELADVLASNGVPPISPVDQDANSDDQAEGKQGGFSWRKLLRARTTKSGSLVLLLLTVGLLYWLTERHRVSLNTTASLYGYTPTFGTSTTTSHLASPTPFTTKSTDLTTLIPAERLWRSLNPLGWSYIKIFVPPASILVLPRSGHSMRPADIRKLSLPTSRLLLPRLRPLFYLFKVVVLPQAVTAGALYALLLYLLKDADLLDAQRDRLGRVDEQQQANETDSSPNAYLENPLLERLKANMLPCSHESDIDLISTSSDGLLALSVGIDDTICLWRFNEMNDGSGTREILSTRNLDPEDPIVCCAISEDRRFIGVCTANGSVQIWEIPDEGQVVALESRRLNGDSSRTSRISTMAFDDTWDFTRQEDPFTITPTKLPSKLATPGPTVLIAFATGSVVSVTADSSSTAIIQPHQLDTSARVSFIRSEGLLNILVVSSETVQVYRNTSSGWLPALLSENSENRITAVSTPDLSLPGLWAVGHKSGSIDIIDEIIGQLLSIEPNASEPIRKIKVVKPSSMRCVGCNTITTDGYLVMSSTATQISIDRIAPRISNNPFCRCLNSSRTRNSLDESTRPSPTRLANGSTDGGLVVPPLWIKKRYSPGTSPRKSPSLLPLPSNGEFPLSSHGGARRLSNLHKPDEQVLSMTSPMDRTSISGGSNHISPAGEFEVQSLGSIVIASPDEHPDRSGEKGSWEVVGDRLVGLKKTGHGQIDDSQFSAFSVDLRNELWNGLCLVVHSIGFGELIDKTKVNGTGTGMEISMSMRERRMERINSLNGRASFSLTVDPDCPGGQRKSLSVPTFERLGYVHINQFSILRDTTHTQRGGGGAVIGGFGNRLGVIYLNDDDKYKDQRVRSVSGIGTSSSMRTGMGLGLSTPTPTRRSISNPTPSAFPPPPPILNPNPNVTSTPTFNARNISGSSSGSGSGHKKLD
ncbi:hypothetical protein I302_102096 [Kwoniella bestiolae CBS 10118]|uniref:Sterol regulatory element-binding protein cleavage-activating protein n=1 Tax=Kwoniella bestiolae CBS 10118 TaxID=1296100 RepID=A0A1B9GE12_9TREE|nr:hypothetical protein I302_00783 [Kwoniella bestiolae CBS 10118]OCF29283.1 hypothetical protein I302_00783 [Kwoniella bestiolae CBS 10118]